MNLNFRPTTETDAHYLIDIDIKCFENAWTPEEWREIGHTCTGAVATINNSPIGMVLSRRTEEGDVEIVKVAVKPAFRRLGISRRLIANCVLHAVEIMAGRVFIVVPETTIDPGESHDLSEWLRRIEFRAEKPLLKNHFHFYGEPENGVVFSLAVPLH